MAAALKTLGVWNDYFSEFQSDYTDTSKVISAALLASLTYQNRPGSLHTELLKAVKLEHMPIKLCHLIQPVSGLVKEEEPEIMQLTYTFNYSYFEKARAVQYYVKANEKFVTMVGGPQNLSAHVMSSRWFSADTWVIHLMAFLDAHNRAQNGKHSWTSDVIVNNQRYGATFELSFQPSSPGVRGHLKEWRVRLLPKV